MNTITVRRDGNDYEVSAHEGTVYLEKNEKVLSNPYNLKIHYSRGGKISHCRKVALTVLLIGITIFTIIVASSLFLC